MKNSYKINDFYDTFIINLEKGLIKKNVNDIIIIKFYKRFIGTTSKNLNILYKE